MKADIRLFAETDIEFALQQTAHEGWDSTADLFQLCLAHDAQGCFVAEDAGRPIGMITTTRYARAGWVGNLIVLPEFRRQGIGHGLMSHALGHLASLGVETVRLEADPMGIRLYRCLGFVDQFESLRFRADPPRATSRGLAKTMTQADLPAVVAFDRECFGDDRCRLFELLLQGIPKADSNELTSSPENRATTGYCVGDDQRVVGYAIVGPSVGSVHIGPWAAVDRNVADDLLRTIVADFRNTAIVVGVPAVNHAAVKLLESSGFGQGPSSLRMIRGPQEAESDPGTLFAITNGAMG